MRSFKTRDVARNVQLGNRCVNRQRKKSERKQHCAKAGPSLCIVLAIWCPPGLWIRCTVALTEQQTGQAPPAFSPLLHPLHLSPSHHRTRRTPALVSSPGGIVTYGNAEDGGPGYNQVWRVNSSMRTDDLVVVPI